MSGILILICIFTTVEKEGYFIFNIKENKIATVKKVIGGYLFFVHLILADRHFICIQLQGLLV